jgi:hypothetical protein
MNMSILRRRRHCMRPYGDDFTPPRPRIFTILAVGALIFGRPASGHGLA